MFRGLLTLVSLRVGGLVLRLMMDRRVPLSLKLLIPAGILYALLPFDMVPDILPWLGRVDDILVLVLSVVLFLAMAPRHVVLEHTGRGGASGQSDGGPRGSSPTGQNVIEGDYHFVDEADDKRK